MENVAIDRATREVDFDSELVTENTRAAYSLRRLGNVMPGSKAGHPQAVIMLTCDAFGVLPPAAKLNHEQAMYYFLSGYTAKVAGTEAGVKEPTSTFSACFGEPFMALSPVVYARLLSEKLQRYKVPCYLINTGWWKGPYGVGERMPISLSRHLVRAALSGELAKAPTERDPVFGFERPSKLIGIDEKHLDMRTSWRDGNAYDEARLRLARMFVENFARFGESVEREILNAAPRPTEYRKGA